MQRRLKFAICILFLSSFAVCQTSYNESSGVIYSPNYPNNYGNNMNILYTITVPVGHYIHLTFLDFKTEDPYDFLNVFEGIGDETVSFKNFSGDRTGQEISIMDSEATLLFTSDLTTTFRGFAIKYDSVIVGNVFIPANTCSSPLHAQTFGIVTSPSFPDNYPNNISCSYLLIAPENHVINLQFVAFNTEDGYDIIYIYDGSNNSYPLIGSYSGTKIPPSITSTSNSLYFFFKSDLVTNFPGFSGVYTSVQSATTDSRKGVLPQILVPEEGGSRKDVNLLKWLKAKKSVDNSFK